MTERPTGDQSGAESRHALTMAAMLLGMVLVVILTGIIALAVIEVNEVRARAQSSVCEPQTKEAQAWEG